MRLARPHGRLALIGGDPSKVVGHPDAFDHQHLSLGLHVTHDLGREVVVVHRDLARSQRAGKSAGESATGSRHHVVDGGGVGLDLRWIEPVVSRNGSVDAEEDRFGFGRQGCGPERASEPTDRHMGFVRDVWHAQLLDYGGGRDSLGQVTAACENLYPQPTPYNHMPLLSCLCTVVQIWTSAPALPAPITNNAVAARSDGDRVTVYSFLGLDSTKRWSGVSSRVFRWEVGTPAWEELRPIPGPGRLAATAQAIGDRLYVFGGYTVAEDGREQSLPHVDVYHPDTETWSRGAPIPVPVDDAVSGVARCKAREEK